MGQGQIALGMQTVSGENADFLSEPSSTIKLSVVRGQLIAPSIWLPRSRLAESASRFQDRHPPQSWRRRPDSLERHRVAPRCPRQPVGN